MSRGEQGGIVLLSHHQDSKYAASANLVVYDARERTRIKGGDLAVGYNGYSMLTFDQRRLTIDHNDVVFDGHEPVSRSLVREVWEVSHGGLLTGVRIEVIDPEGRKLTRPNGKPRSAAVGKT